MDPSQSVIRNIAVKDYMDTKPVQIRLGTLITEVVDQLLASGRTGAAVVDGQGLLVGFVSEQDCLQMLLQSSYHCDTPASVEDVMRHEVLTVSKEDGIIELAQSMSDRRPKIYPVVERQKLIGVIDRKQVLAALRDNQRQCFI